MSWQRHGRRLTTVTVLLLVAAFLWRGAPVAKLAIATMPAPKAPLLTAAATTSRKIYPFSVIYGGAHSGDELARARKLDSVVAQHYLGFGDHPAVRSMGKDALMYVSYRKANQVFWTRKKHRIPQGELVLSDGENLARTRCGNRLSPKPQAPVATEEDPTEEAMDIPDGPKPTLASANPITTAPDADFFIPANPADAGSALSSGGPNSPMNPKNAAGIGDSEKPYGFPSQPRSGGPFFGGVGYPGMPGVTGMTGAGSAANQTATPTNLIAPENGVVTPEPGTLSLLFVALLLGSPTLIGWRRNKIDSPTSK